MTYSRVTGYPFGSDRAAGYGPEPQARRADDTCWCLTPLWPVRGSCPACVADRAASDAHEREATTPMEDGTLLADCSCGGTYSVPQGGDEYEALEAARRGHIASEAAAKGEGR